MSQLSMIFLSAAIFVIGAVYWSITGPAVIPVGLTLWGGIWLLINIIRYARST